MTFSKSLTVSVIAATACALLPAMAATEFDQQKKQIEVSIQGYDLTNAADASEVFQMISTASKRVCKTAGVRETLRERVLQNKCRADAIISAVAAIDAPELTEIMHGNLKN